jgi:hypothetical protein
MQTDDHPTLTFERQGRNVTADPARLEARIRELEDELLLARRENRELREELAAIEFDEDDEDVALVPPPMPDGAIARMAGPLAEWVSVLSPTPPRLPFYGGPFAADMQAAEDKAKLGLEQTTLWGLSTPEPR